MEAFVTSMAFLEYDTIIQIEGRSQTAKTAQIRCKGSLCELKDSACPPAKINLYQDKNQATHLEKK